MRILHVITTVGTGGAERMLLNVVAHGDSRFHHGVVALRHGGMLTEPLRDAGAEVWNCGLSAGERSPGAAIAIRRIINGFAPDIVQGWMYHGNLAACLATGRWRASSPIIWGIHHSIDDLGNEKPMTRALIRIGARLSGWPHRIIYVSRVSRRQHQALGYRDRFSTIIPNGFDCTRFHPRAGAREEVRRALGLHPDAILIAKIAVVRPMKDHANLLKACALLQRRDLHFHLALIGQRATEENADLMRLVESAGVRDRTLLLGERHDIPRLIAGLDGLVVSSAWGEAFPIVLGEAMASGVPCVTTDVGDSAWMVADTGVVVPAREPEALADGLAQLVGMDPDRRRHLGMRARQRVVDRFELRRITERYYELYDEVATQEAAPRPSHHERQEDHRHPGQLC